MIHNVLEILASKTEEKHELWILIDRDNIVISYKVLVAQSCLTLCDPMGCSPPDSFVHEILQAGIVEWVAISFSRRSSFPKDQTQVSWVAGGFFAIWATREWAFKT